MLYILMEFRMKYTSDIDVVHGYDDRLRECYENHCFKVRIIPHAPRAQLLVENA